MGETLESFLIAEAVYSLVLMVGFLGLFCRKIMKLDKLGENQGVTIPLSIWVKFWLLIALIVLFALHVVLAFSLPSYWLSGNPDFSLVSLLYIVSFTLQLYIVLKEVSKCQQRYVVNLLFWAMCLVAEVIEVVVVEILLPAPNPTTIIQILISLACFSLLFVSLICDRHTAPADIVSQLREDSIRSPLSRRGERIAPSSRLYVEFNRQFQVIQRKDELTCMFKMAVYLDENTHIVSRSDHEFATLGLEMAKAFPGRQEVALIAGGGKFENMMKYGEERQRCFESYLIELTKSDQFYTPFLLQFLQIPAASRGRLIRNEKFHYIKKDTTLSDEKTIPLFKVTALKGHILVSNPDLLQLDLQKTAVDMVEFQAKLIEEKRLGVQVMCEQPPIEEIIHFVELVVNKKNLWRSFAAWAGVGPQIENKVYSYFDVWNIGFRGITMGINGHESLFDKDGKLHTVYLLAIYKHDDSDLLPSPPTILKKRYNDFHTLDRHIHRFLETQPPAISANLPALPPKFSPFGSKTSPKSRQMRFDHYVRELIKVEGINHCIRFLEFLEVEGPLQHALACEMPQLQGEDFEHSERSYFGELNLKHQL